MSIGLRPEHLKPPGYLEGPPIKQTRKRNSSGGSGPVTFETVREIARELPGAVEGTSYGTLAFRVGNIRELRNAIEHAAIVARGHAVCPEHLPPARNHPIAASPTPSGEIEAQLAAWAREAHRRSSGQSDDPVLYERFLGLTEPPVLKAILQECQQNRAAAAPGPGYPPRDLAAEAAEIRHRVRR
jgi:hypothetical protein